MSNIRGLGDVKKNETGQGRGRGQPQPNDQMQGQGMGFGGFPGLSGLLGFGGQGQPQQGGKADHKNVKVLTKDGELAQELTKAGSKPVIVDFNAVWCGPCKYIGPIFADYSTQYPNIVFLSVDVDKLEETASENNIRAMPTFIMFKNKKQVERMEGADPNGLKAILDKHNKAAPSESTQPTGGYKLGGGGDSKPQEHPLLNKVNVAPVADQPAPKHISPLVSGTSKPTTTTTSSSQDVDPILLQAMLDMGFEEAHAKAALVATKNANIDAAIDWCASHPAPEEPMSTTTTTTTETKVEPKQSEPKQSEPKPETKPETKPEVKPMDVDKPAEPKVPHVHNAICNICMEKVVGIRYKCKDCDDFDMCEGCYKMRLIKHDPDHDFDAYETELEIEEKERKPLTPEELAEKKRQLQEKIVRLRQERQKKEEKDQIESEKVRRQSAKDAQAAKSAWEDKQRERDAAIRKREAEEEKKAKEAIRKKLEQDKLERAAKKKPVEGATTATTATTTAPTTTETAAPAQKKEYTEATIQLRLPDGNVMKATFKPTDPLRTVHNHVALLLNSSKYNLVSNFPKKVWSHNDPALDTTTLQQADCVPTGTFVVQKS